VPGLCSSLIAPGLCSSLIAPGLCSSLIAPGLCSSLIAPGLCSSLIAPGLCEEEISQCEVKRQRIDCSLPVRVCLPLLRMFDRTEQVRFRCYARINRKRKWRPFSFSLKT